MRIRGPIAENKDWARSARLKRILPAIRTERTLRLDFSAVRVATQSFVHALIAEAIHLHGHDALQFLDFHRCSPQVQEAIKTVVTYTIRARDIAESVLPDKTDIRPVDVPQADDLVKIRGTVATLSDGPQPLEAVAEDTGFSLRHVHYRIHAARVLGLARIASRIAVITPNGEALLRTAEGSAAEAELLRECVRNSTILQRLAPGLLGRRGPPATSIATRIERYAKLAPSTALRRSKALLAWRHFLLKQQLSLSL